MKNLLAVCVAVLLIFIILGALPIHGEDEVYDKVLRLHVLANSDSNEDQALKLKVRDAVLSLSSELLENIDSKEAAADIINENMEAFIKTASDTVAENGFDYPVNITLEKERYPTKSYESLCFPSGEYLSLKVMIGEAEGQNWWCVLFPPMCLSAASAQQKTSDAFISVGLTGEQYKIITETDSPKYSVRFKILETIEQMR